MTVERSQGNAAGHVRKVPEDATLNDDEGVLAVLVRAGGVVLRPRAQGLLRRGPGDDQGRLPDLLGVAQGALGGDPPGPDVGGDVEAYHPGGVDPGPAQGPDEGDPEGPLVAYPEDVAQGQADPPPQEHGDEDPGQRYGAPQDRQGGDRPQGHPGVAHHR